MDTADVAAELGTTPRTLRQFLRSDHSTFQAVGSGARYDFTERDLPTLKKRFTDWQKAGKPRPDGGRPAKTSTTTPAQRRTTRAQQQQARDRQEWEEEGPVVIEDIRDPRVRARVRARAADAENRLMERLVAAGLHVYQLGDRKSA